MTVPSRITSFPTTVSALSLNSASVMVRGFASTTTSSSTV